MTTTTNSPSSDLAAARLTAHQAVDQADACPSAGPDLDAFIDVAQRACDQLRVAASEPLSPSDTLTAASAAALADLADIIGGLRFAFLGEDLAAAHAMAARGGYGELCTAIRGPRGRKIVRTAVETQAIPLGDRPAAVDAMLRRFVLALAAQLQGEYPAETEVLLRELPDLEARLAAVAARRADQVHEEQARQQREIAAAADREWAAVVSFFRANPLREFLMADDYSAPESTGSAIASQLKRYGRRARMADRAIAIYKRIPHPSAEASA